MPRQAVLPKGVQRQVGFERYPAHDVASSSSLHPARSASSNGRFKSELMGAEVSRLGTMFAGSRMPHKTPRTWEPRRTLQ